MKAKRWFGRHAGEALGGRVQEVAAEVRRAGLAVHVVGAGRPAPLRSRRCILLVETPEGTVAGVEVR